MRLISWVDFGRFRSTSSKTSALVTVGFPIEEGLYPVTPSGNLDSGSDLR
jgi:hypothetical protein